jgi:hypothetical protein
VARRLKSHAELFQSLKARLPKALVAQRETLDRALARKRSVALKKRRAAARRLF